MENQSTKPYIRIQPACAAVSELDDVLEKISKVPGSILPSDDEILQEIREICNGLALSDRARAARYDKIVEILKEKADG